MIEDPRLDRIERKIDELGEAFVIMARVEEKIVNLEQSRVESNRRYDQTVAKLLVDVKEIKEKQIEQDSAISDNSRVTGYIKWIMGTIVTAAVGALALQFFSA